MMACQDDLMKQEQLSNSIFSEAKLPIEISNNNGQVILSVTDKAGQKHIFQGEKATNTQALTDYSWSYQPENTKSRLFLTLQTTVYRLIQVVTAKAPLGKLKTIRL